MPGLDLSNDNNRAQASNAAEDLSSQQNSGNAKSVVMSSTKSLLNNTDDERATNKPDILNGFVHDDSSRATVQQQKAREKLALEQKLAAEEAAALAAKKAEDEAREFQRLRDLSLAQEVSIKDLELKLKTATTNVTELQTQKSQLQTEKSQLQTQKSQLEKNLSDEKQESNRARQEAANNGNTVRHLQRQLSLDSKNNLDPGCHGRKVYFIHLYSRVAMDYGAEYGKLCHGWGFNMTNSNQVFSLEKVDPNDRLSNWTIGTGERYMEFQSGGCGGLPRCSGRRSGGDALMQEWKIGRVGAYGYVLENARFGNALDIDSAFEEKNGKQLRSWDRNDSVAQVFGIMLT